MEEYEDGTILYGQGNFLFKHLDDECWKTSLLIDLEISRNGKKVNFIPLVQSIYGVKLADEIDRKEILSGFINRSKEIKDENFLKNKYKELAREMATEYKFAMGGRFTHNYFFRLINKLTGHKLPNLFYSKRELLSIYDYIMCESQYDLLIEGIRNEIEGV